METIKETILKIKKEIEKIEEIEKNIIETSKKSCQFQLYFYNILLKLKTLEGNKKDLKIIDKNLDIIFNDIWENENKFNFSKEELNLLKKGFYLLHWNNVNIYNLIDINFSSKKTKGDIDLIFRKKIINEKEDINILRYVETKFSSNLQYDTSKINKKQFENIYYLSKVFEEDNNIIDCRSRILSIVFDIKNLEVYQNTAVFLENK